MKPKLIIFDFDGVIADTYELNFSLTRKVFPYMTDEEFRTQVEAPESLPLFMRAIRALFYKYFTWKNKDGILRSQTFGQIPDTLARLSSLCPLIIISATNPKTITSFLDKNGLKKYFVDVVGASWLGTKKDALLKITKENKLVPSDCVFISDTAKDITTGLSIDIPSIAVTWGYQEQSVLEKAHPTHIIDQPSQLVEILG